MFATIAQNILISGVAFIVMLSIAVFFHELGHFMAARACGMHVEKFSIGFGRVIWSRTDAKGCAWQVALWPLGGFVKIKGFAKSEEGGSDPDSYVNKPVWKRMSVVFAGPLYSILLGIVVIGGIYSVNGRPLTMPTIQAVIDGGVADQAGLEAGDRITSIGWAPVSRFEQVVLLIQQSPGQAVEIGYVRDGAAARLVLVPDSILMRNIVGNEMTVGRIGIQGPEPVMVQMNTYQAFGYGVTDSIETIYVTLKAIKDIFAGYRPVNEVIGGPVEVAHVSGEALKLGIAPFFYILGVISISLGIMNLMPIPYLDGGHLSFLAWELVTRRAVNETVYKYASYAGLAILLSLMTYVTFDDIRERVVPLIAG